jgi:hypothetical protein
MAQTPPASAGGAPQAAPQPKPAAPSAQRVAFIGNPSLLRVAGRWRWQGPEAPCATFRVMAAPSESTITLHTSGLGHALLAEVSGERCPTCPDAGHCESISLNKGSEARIERLVAIRPDISPLTTPGSSMKGVVVARAGDEAAQFELQVERPPLGEHWTAAAWTLGVILPAAITFAFGQVVVRLAAHQKARSDFRDYRMANTKSVIAFLEAVDVVIRSGGERPGETIYELSVSRDIFTKMTTRGTRALSEACVRGDLRSIVAVLRKLFPEFTAYTSRLDRSLAHAANAEPRGRNASG